MKVAILNDYLTAYGGAERVLDKILELYPDADILTSLFWPEFLPEIYKSRKVKTSVLKFLPHFVSLRSIYRKLSYFVFIFFDLNQYDLVIFNTNGPATWVSKNKVQKFFAYYHKVPNFHFERNGFIANWFAKENFDYAQNLDLIATNSFYNTEVIKQALHKRSEIIYPPINIQKSKNLIENNFDLKNFIDWNPKDYFIFVGRLEEFKGLRYIIQAINKTGQKLVVIGEGPLRSELDKYENIKFVGFCDDKTKFNLIHNAKALINGAIEQFGIVFVESLIAQTPVIAFNDGGAKELISEDFGILFNEQNRESVKNAIEIFLRNEIIIQDNAKLQTFLNQFEEKTFKDHFTSLISLLHN